MGEMKEAGMVERVARAIALQDCCDPDFIDTKGRVQWTYHVELARAAIAAMLEPTDAMVWAGATASDHPSVYMSGPSELGKRRTRQIYRAAVKQALELDPPHADR